MGSMFPSVFVRGLSSNSLQNLILIEVSKDFYTGGDGVVKVTGCIFFAYLYIYIYIQLYT